MFSGSPWRASHLKPLALYCFWITPTIASATGLVDLDVVPGCEMKPVCLSTIMIL